MFNRNEKENEELELENKLKTNKKVIIVTIVMLFLMVFVVFPLDDAQQKEYLMVREAYQELEAGDYASAWVKFEQYKENHSDIFWKLRELAGEFAGEEYRYDSIVQAIKECEEGID